MSENSEGDTAGFTALKLQKGGHIVVIHREFGGENVAKEPNYRAWIRTEVLECGKQKTIQMALKIAQHTTL